MFATKKGIAQTSSWWSNLITNKKKLTLSLAVLAAVVVGAGLWIQSLMNVVAKVDGHKITRAELDNLTPRLTKFYEYNEDEEALADPQKATLDYLIEDKIIRVEAAKRGITVGPSDINSRYQESVSAYENEETFIKAIDTIYGWTPELHKWSIERQILQEQLEPQILATRNGKMITVQHLIGGRLINLSKDEYKARAKATIETIQKDVRARGFDTALEAAAKKYTRTDDDVDPLIVGTGEFSWLSNEPGVDKEALAAVFAARQGDTTDIIETETFYGVFKLESLPSGNAASWDEFITNYSGKKVYESRLEPWYKSIWQGFSAKLQYAEPVNATTPPTPPPPRGGGGGGSKPPVDSDKDGIPDKDDKCPNQAENINGIQDKDGCPDNKNDECDSNCHGTEVNGYVKDSVTGEGIKGVSAYLYTTGWRPTCLSKPNDPDCNCGPKNLYDTTQGPNGKFLFARGDGRNCQVNCYWGFWKMEFTKEGYEKATLDIGYLNQNGGTRALGTIKMTPKPAIVEVQAKRSDNNNNIGVPIQSWGNLSHHGGNTTFSREHRGDIEETFEAPATATGNGGAPLEYDKSKGNNGWSGCTSGNQAARRCGVKVEAGKSKTITVWYKPVENDDDDEEEEESVPVSCAPANTSILAGLSAGFTAAGGASGNYGWSYTGSPSFAQPNGLNNGNLTISYDTAGTYTISVTRNGGSDSCTLTVNPLPTQDIPGPQGAQPSGNVDFNQGERPPVY